MRYYIGADFYGDDLYHFGIKGMQWGVRRTPEELGHRKEEKEKRRREKILDNPRKLAKHYDEFSEQEIQKAMKRHQQKQQLRDLSNKRLKSGKDLCDSILSYGKLAGLGVGLVTAGVGAFNVFRGAKNMDDIKESIPKLKEIGQKVVGMVIK